MKRLALILALVLAQGYYYWTYPIIPYPQVSYPVGIPLSYPAYAGFFVNSPSLYADYLTVLCYRYYGSVC